MSIYYPSSLRLQLTELKKNTIQRNFFTYFHFFPLTAVRRNLLQIHVCFLAVGKELLGLNDTSTGLVCRGFSSYDTKDMLGSFLMIQVQFTPNKPKNRKD